MTTIAFIGSGSTGKTTTMRALALVRPHWHYFESPTKHQVASFGYTTIWDVIRQTGETAYNYLSLNALAVIDPAVNSLIQPDTVIVQDKSALDTYAYEIVENNIPPGQYEDNLTRRMVTHYASLVDQFVLFPFGVIPLVEDGGHRKTDSVYQKKLQDTMERLLQDFVTPAKVHSLQAVDLDERVQEVLEVATPYEVR